MNCIIKWNNDMKSIRFWPSETKARACDQKRAGVSGTDEANSGCSSIMTSYDGWEGIPVVNL